MSSETQRAAAPSAPGASGSGPARRLVRVLRAAPSILATGLFLVLLVTRADFLIDDGFIAFRHARNWVELGVPTFNAGVSPPVEGFSDFLWVALLAAANRLGCAIPNTAQVIGAVAGLATIVVFAQFARRHEGLTGAPLALGALLVATAPAFVVWSSGGLETALFTLLVFATYTTLVAVRSEVGAGLLGGLLALSVALVRVEGFLWVLVLLAAVAIARGARGARFPLAFGVYLTGFVAFLLWRHGLYGEWLANTAGAKLGLSPERLARGAKNLASYGLASATPVFALVAVPLVMRRARAQREATLAVLLVVVAFMAYTVLVGGDWMPFWRFLAPATPFVALLAARALSVLPSTPGMFVGAALVAVQVLPLFDAGLAPRRWLEALSYRDFRGPWQSEWQRLATARENGVQFEQLGRALAATTTAEDSLVFGAIGAVGWYAPRLFLHDRNGLVDRELADLGDDLGTGIDTAGHDRRAPRAWFLSRTAPCRPTLFHAALVNAPPTGPITGPESPGFADAVRAVMQGQILAQAGEAPLLEHTVVTATPLGALEGVPEGSTLLLWRRAPDVGTAQRFWAALGVSGRPLR